MAGRAPVDPVKPLALLLFSEDEAAERARGLLERQWGPADHQGAALAFNLTGYYEAEMGPGLKRQVVSFGRLVPPEALVELKLAAAEVEGALHGPSGRRVNIDPGYLDLHKLVLGSFKYGPMKVHLGQGVHADLVARYFEGRWEHLEWTFQDFKERLYDEDLLRIRALYREALRSASGGGVSGGGAAGGGGGGRGR